MTPIHPVARLLALIFTVAAAFVTANLAMLSLAIAVMILLLVRVGLQKAFLKFCLAIWLPMTIMLLITWCIPFKGQQEAFRRSGESAFDYAMVVSLRVALVAGCFQLAFLSIPPRLLPITLRHWGIRGEGMVVALGVIATGPELSMRAEQIVMARRARGLLGGGRWNRIKETPRLLRPLFVWSIRSAVHRSEAWEQRSLLLRVQAMPTETASFSMPRSAAAILLALLFLALAILSRIPALSAHFPRIA